MVTTPPPSARPDGVPEHAEWIWGACWAVETDEYDPAGEAIMTIFCRDCGDEIPVIFGDGRCRECDEDTMSSVAFAEETGETWSDIYLS